MASIPKADAPTHASAERLVASRCLSVALGTRRGSIVNPLPVPLLTPEDCAIWNALWGGCLLRGGRPHVWSHLADVSINGDRRDAALMHVLTQRMMYERGIRDRGCECQGPAAVAIANGCEL